MLIIIRREAPRFGWFNCIWTPYGLFNTEIWFLSKFFDNDHKYISKVSPQLFLSKFLFIIICCLKIVIRYQVFLSNSNNFWIDLFDPYMGTVTGTTNPVKSWTESNGNHGLFYTPQKYRSRTSSPYAVKYHTKDSFFHGVAANVLDCNILIRVFELQSRYFVHFQANGKLMNPLITTHPWDGLNSTTTGLLQGLLWH